MADKIGVLLNHVGNLLALDIAYPLDGTFLYSEAEWQMVDMSIFRDLGDHLLYRDPMEGLGEALLSLWEATPADMRWTSMQYRTLYGKFDATFGYEPLDPEVGTIERRERILRERYGNKRIVYPPLGPA